MENLLSPARPLPIGKHGRLFVYLTSFILAALLVGCSSKSMPAAMDSENVTTTREESFSQQLAHVTAKESATISLENTPITDADLAQISDGCILQVLKVDARSDLSAEGLAHLAKAKDLVHLRLATKLDAASAEQIAKLTSLKILNLPSGEISDEDLIKLAKLPRLIQLRIGSGQISDAGIAELSKSHSLLRLHLMGCPITDRSIAMLGEMPQLESLYLDEINYSDAAIEQLITKRPMLHLHLNQLHHEKDQRPAHGVHGT